MLAAALVGPALAKSTFAYTDASEPSTIDPAKANREFTITRNVFDRVIGFDLDNTSKFLPALETEWS